MTKNYFNLKQRLQLLIVVCICGLIGVQKVSAQAVLRLHYSFEPSTIDGATITDVTGNGYDGMLLNEAFGATDGDSIDVVDLGSSNGYIDMGTATGTLINGFTDYSVAGYYYLYGTNDANANGNWLWCFSNTVDGVGDPSGMIFMEPRRMRHAITPTNYGAEKAVQLGENQFIAGEWVHIAYTQSGTAGTLFVNGVAKTSGTVDMLPNELGITSYNFIGRPAYAADAYLTEAMVADFRIYEGALSASEMFQLANLTAPADYPLDLIEEWENLDLGDLSAVTDDIYLPTAVGDELDIVVSWASSQPAVIDETGVVTQPEALKVDVVLKATLSKNGYELKKDFIATVLPKSELEFPLIARYAFENETITNDTLVVSTGEVVLDQAIIKNEAEILTIGTEETGKFNVLYTGIGQGYMDLGTTFGTYMYSLTDYTIVCYLRVDESYANMGANGNFVYCFSNTDSALVKATGQIFYELRRNRYAISSTNWAGESGVQSGSNFPQDGSWHLVAYSQNSGSGTLSLDGVEVQTGAMPNPSLTLPVVGQTGTLYNWIGRPCYAADTYAEQTMVYDFQVYTEALTVDDINDLFIDEWDAINTLNAAYAANSGTPITGFVTPQNSSNIKIQTQKGAIKIIGLRENDVIAISTVLGQSVPIENKENISLIGGVYIVTINDISTKVIVK